MLAPYKDCLSRPHVTYLFATNLLGRLPNGMAPLGIALFLRSHGMGFGVVGGITALYGLSTAVGGPLLGRAVDRHGQPRVLWISAVVSAAGFLALIWAGGNTGAAAAAAAVAGLASPPLEPCLRTLWPDVLDDKRAIATAYALDAALQEVVFAAGPLFVVLIGWLAGPGPALAVTTVAMVAGTLAYVSPEPVRRWRAEPRRPDWAGPLRSSMLRRLLVALACVGVGLGGLNIDTVAYQEHIGQSGLSGILLGVNAAGALIGGLIYGARQWKATTMRQLQVLLACMACCYLLLALVPPPAVAIALVFLAGLFLSPVLACGFAIIGDVAPPGTATEAFAWMVTAVLTGNAAGSSAAGVAEQHLGLWASFLVPGLAALASAVVALVLLRDAAQPSATRSVKATHP
ncbi:MFS transporter [Streptomyces cinnamoneus]|uniref:MFS transporter n=1 Tax=Streptomyces cinnamoneus TaxID=53446 RepID=A0A918TN37_STRCJ|nr:MFS transporter [Streptomyces cinnamoneus]GHC55108.1 MFS transporter [Streptomyces cinnamoneus]